MANPLNILIVEDNEDDCLLLVRELRKGGYDPVFERVDTAETMQQALRHRPWDLVVSDYLMPRFSGLAALSVLHESGQDLPFIIVSGNIGEDIAVRAMKAGAHDYIIKGNLARLIPAIERELREAESRRERSRAEHSLRTIEMQYRLLFESSLDAVLLMTPDGSFLAANSAACRILNMTEEEILKAGKYGILDPADSRVQMLTEERQRTGRTRGEVTLLRKDGTRVACELSSAQFTDKDGNTRVSIIARDITDRKLAEEKLSRLNRLYAVLSKVNEAIIRIHDPATLYREVCRIAVEDGSFKMAWIGLLDPATKRVSPVASHGDANGYLDDIAVIADEVPEGRGPTGRAVISGTPVISADIEADPAMLPWREKALAHGFRSSSAFPICSGPTIIGALTAYASMPRSFTEEEIKLLAGLAEDISFAVEAMENDKKRRDAEEWLQQSITEIRDLYNNAPCGYHSLDQDGVIMQINDTELTWLGYERSEVVGKKKITDFYTGEGKERFKNSYPQFKKAGEIKDLEFDLVRRDGTIMTVLVSATALRDSAGRFLSSRSTLFDVTDRKEGVKKTELTNALLALFQKKYTCREYLDEACALIRSWSRFHNVGIRLMDQDNTVPFASCKGYDESFLQTENELSVTKDRCICTRIIAGAAIPADRSAMTSNGSFFSTYTEKFLATLSDEELKQYRGVCMKYGFRSLAVIPIRYRDSTIGAIHLADEREGLIEEKNVLFLEQLANILGEAVFRFNVEEEQARLVLAVESSADAVAITDHRGYLKFVNSAFEQITGYRKEEVLSGTLHILDSSKQDEEFYSMVREAVAREGVWRGRLWSRKKDGTLYLEDCTYSPVRDSNGAVISYISVKRDVTENARLESIAESVNMMNNIGYVFSGVRHEIGNPINSAKMILSVLQLKLDSSPPDVIKGYVDRTLVEIGRVEQLLKNLKNFNLYEKPELRDLEVQAYLHDFHKLVAEDLEKKGIAFSLEVPADAGRVCVDPRALHQVLINLVTNAADAVSGRPAPSIRIIAANRAGTVHLRLVDNGVGMTEKQQQELFKPFYTSKHSGTGLGLVIVKKMLSRMNCGIAITSALEEGTTVDISIPEGTHEGKR
jgi:PAS domain S-box-containing protein